MLRSRRGERRKNAAATQSNLIDSPSRPPQVGARMTFDRVSRIVVDARPSAIPLSSNARNVMGQFAFALKGRGLLLEGELYGMPELDRRFPRIRLIRMSEPASN